MTKPFCVLLCCLFLQTGRSQDDSLRRQHNKRVIFFSTSTFIGVSSLVALQQAWYAQYNTGKFHFFNDEGDWLQMDKAGHIFTTYQTGRMMMNTMQRLGYSRKKQLIFGGCSGLAYMTMIEVLDGYSRGWGFSPADEIANVFGSGLAVGQEAIWRRQYVQLKFSYHSSGLAKYNAPLLGKNDYTRLLKDYNAQTYWVSFSPFAFIPSTKKLDWLCLAIGYGADGMLGGSTNVVVVTDPQTGQVIHYDRYRQVYLSLDLDLTRLHPRAVWLRKVFSALNVLKFPFPAIEFSRGKTMFHPIYF